MGLNIYWVVQLTDCQIYSDFYLPVYCFSFGYAYTPADALSFETF